jgi:hypothetical protein
VNSSGVSPNLKNSNGLEPNNRFQFGTHLYRFANFKEFISLKGFFRLSQI